MWSCIKIISKVSAIIWWQLHDHTTLQTFFMQGKVIFSGFWEKLRGKRQNPAPKKLFSKVHEVTFLIISWRYMGHTATLCMCKMISEVTAINWWQPHDHTTLQTFFMQGKVKLSWFFMKWKWILGSILARFEVVQKKTCRSTSKSSIEKTIGDMKKLKAFRGGVTRLAIQCTSNHPYSSHRYLCRWPFTVSW